MQSDRKLETWIYANAGAGDHAAGTCRMIGEKLPDRVLGRAPLARALVGC